MHSSISSQNSFTWSNRWYLWGRRLLFLKKEAKNSITLVVKPPEGRRSDITIRPGMDGASNQTSYRRLFLTTRMNRDIMSMKWKCLLDSKFSRQDRKLFFNYAYSKYHFYQLHFETLPLRQLQLEKFYKWFEGKSPKSNFTKLDLFTLLVSIEKDYIAMLNEDFDGTYTSFERSEQFIIEATKSRFWELYNYHQALKWVLAKGKMKEFEIYNHWEKLSEVEQVLAPQAQEKDTIQLRRQQPTPSQSPDIVDPEWECDECACHLALPEVCDDDENENEQQIEAKLAQQISNIDAEIEEFNQYKAEKLHEFNQACNQLEEMKRVTDIAMYMADHNILNHLCKGFTPK